LSFSQALLKQLQKNIIGLKIICSGKWKKTRSGRKQKLCVKFGQIVSSKVSNTLLYDFNSQTTRFGVIGIKVWIAYKNQF
jgi:ribosomal protein S3